MTLKVINPFDQSVYRELSFDTTASLEKNSGGENGRWEMAYGTPG